MIAISDKAKMLLARIKKTTIKISVVILFIILLWYGTMQEDYIKAPSKLYGIAPKMVIVELAGQLNLQPDGIVANPTRLCEICATI